MKEIRYFNPKQHKEPEFSFSKNEEATGVDEAICVYCGAFISDVESQLNFDTTNISNEIECNACGKKQEVWRSIQYTTVPSEEEDE